MEETLAAAIRDALARLPDLPEGFDASAVPVEFQTPGNPEHGDLATNVALQLAKPLGQPPRKIATAIAMGMTIDSTQVETVEVAGPGFLNIRFAADVLTSGLTNLLAQGDAYGHTTAHAGETAIVEYVSANPTGPLTVGHGRNAVLGDTIANLLAATGYGVTREYYFNDAGRQMRVLGRSVRARYTALVLPNTPTHEQEDGTVVPEGFPDGGYLGGYITDIAQTLADAHGKELLGSDEETAFTDAAKTAIFAEIDTTLKRLGVHMDTQFNEHTLYTSNAIWDVVEALKAKGLAYEKDGATWFKTSELGKTATDAAGTAGVDVVLVKSTGEPTYRLPDIAYHMEKLSRGFALVLDVFGADHIATYPDVLRGVTAMGGDASKIDVIVYQFVTLVRDGQPVKMSTRKANYVTLDELMDEVGEDVTRFFFLMRSPNTHLEFDLDLAKEASEKNPVFYLQYAHARVSSIQAKATETGLPDVRGTDGTGADYTLLTHASETGLIKTLLLFPAEVTAAAEGRAPHRLAGYLRDVAVAFSQFYRDCRIIGEPHDVATARLHLAEATRRVLGHGLGLLGVSAPERMDRAEAE